MTPQPEHRTVALLLTEHSRQEQTEETGGKGKNLILLRRLGFPVPHFAILSASVFDMCSAMISGEIAAVLGTLKRMDTGQIAAVSSRLRQLVRGLPLPADVLAAILRGYSDVAGADGLLSVRSSVVGEDGREHSFAGQMDSILNVGRQDLPDAIRTVWASVFSERALAYRVRSGLPLTNIRIAVVLQRMLTVDASGVLFTRDPVSGARVCVLTAGYGLGEGVVTDAVECDTYRCACSGSEVSSVIVVKTRRMQPMKGGRPGVRLGDVPSELHLAPVLEDVEVLMLRDWAIRLESALDGPVDMEWARTPDGTLHLLQVRPITATVQDRRDLRVWDNSNIVESYPGITLPLTFSFIRNAYEQAFRKALSGLLLRSAPIRSMDQNLSSLLGLIHGRVYYNLRNWYGMLSLLPGFGRHKRAWDQMIGIAHTIEIPEAQLSVIDRIGGTVISCWRLLRIRGNAYRFHSGFDVLYRHLASLDVDTATAGELSHCYDRTSSRALKLWPRTLYNDFAAMTWYDILKRLCVLWGCRDGLHNELLCAEPGIESVKPVRALVRMAERIRVNPQLSALFARNHNAQVLHAVQTEPAFVALREFLEEYLALYGDRGFEELKLESQTYRDDPEALIALLRGYVVSTLDVLRMEREETRKREHAEEELRRTLKNPWKRQLVRLVLNRARASVASRENMRFARSRLYGFLRRLFRRLGLIFVEQGVLDSPGDIHYLEVDEIFAIARGTSVEEDPRGAVARRKLDYTEAAKHNPPSRFVTEGIPRGEHIPDVGVSESGIQAVRGTGCSAGTVTAEAVLVGNPKDAGDIRGRILVARSTDPGWVFLMITAAGLIVEQGSVLSHTAIIGRELGIPTIVGASGAMNRIPDGAMVTMNGSTGELRWD